MVARFMGEEVNFPEYVQDESASKSGQIVGMIVTVTNCKAIQL